jgi:hypothetical protein
VTGAQGDLPFGRPPSSQESRLEREFREFHAANPNVYQLLVKLARDAVGAGKRRIGIGMLWEVMRWHFWLAVQGDDEFKLNNNHRSRYARLIMESETDLQGMFETRVLRS